MTGIEIINEIEKTQQAIIKGNIDLKTYGVKKAKTEMDYKRALRKEMLKLRYQEKLPGNLVENVAKGQEEVSKLRCNRDIARVEYETAKYQLKGLENSIEALRSILAYDKTELKNAY